MRKDIRGIGTTDSENYAQELATRFDYQNTFFHKEPRLDISTQALAPCFVSSSDFLISSEVFEHVPPPVGLAFRNAFRILKPGGLFLLTVPYGLQEATIEHFPELHDFAISERDGVYVLRNVTQEGVLQEFENLVFHGGPGSTLEMRIFAESDLLQHLSESGFVDVKVYRTPDFRFGVWWPEPWSFPISARKPRD